MAENKGLPYRGLINLYLRDCAQSHRDLKPQWQSSERLSTGIRRRKRLASNEVGVTAFNFSS